MRVVESAADLNSTISALKKEGKTVGFVPTMGALHAGHISLVEASVRENQITVVSIFVNPTQFGPKEDLSRYPRNIEKDKALLEAAGCDILFLPSVDEMYPAGAATWVTVDHLPEHLCGLSRPGHFRGVTTVVAKLFNIVRPDKAYFGQKDYQQARILEKMNEDLNFYIEMRVMPIVREKDGLAMSSRNQYLNPEQRKKALILYRCLELAKKAGYDYRTSPVGLTSMLKAFVKSEVPDARIDYISLVDPHTLEDAINLQNPTLLALAIYIGDTRLIDNTIIDICEKV